MRGLILPDLHITTKQPSSRADEITNALKLKLQQIKEIVEGERVDAVFCAGDVFDAPYPPTEAIAIAVRFFSSLPRVYLIKGQHDLYGRDYDTLTAYDVITSYKSCCPFIR